MKSAVTAFIVVVAFAAASPCDEDDAFILLFEAFDKKYELRVPAQALSKSKWKDDAENPPISAKKALQLAEPTKDLLAEDRVGFQWKLAALTLSPVDDTWRWTVVYQAVPDNHDHSELHSIMVVVLMDGTVITPTEAKDNDAPRESPNLN